MTCKDCIHHVACNRPDPLDIGCEDFSDRSLWVKLPCKVGDTVYVIYDGYVTCAYVLAFYIDKDGGMFDLCIK